VSGPRSVQRETATTFDVEVSVPINAGAERPELEVTVAVNVPQVTQAKLAEVKAEIKIQLLRVVRSGHVPIAVLRQETR
jgi:hypothetical protein